MRRVPVDDVGPSARPEKEQNMTDDRTPALSAERVSIGIEELKARHGPPPWAAPLVVNDQLYGHGHLPGAGPPQ